MTSQILQRPFQRGEEQRLTSLASRGPGRLCRIGDAPSPQQDAHQAGQETLPSGTHRQTLPQAPSSPPAPAIFVVPYLVFLLPFPPSPS